MFVFLVCIIMLLIGSMYVKYLCKKVSSQISFSLENDYHLECYHLIFVFVKTKTCMSPPAPPLLFSLVPSSPVPFFLLSDIYIYIAFRLSTKLYIAKNVCFRDMSLNVQWDYTADLYLKPTKYSKILRRKLPSRVIFEMYNYKRIKSM